MLSVVLVRPTIYSAVVTIHDGNQQRSALGLVTQATAMHVATLASARLERLALEGFAPAGPLAASTPGPDVGRATIELLARRQREARLASCRDAAAGLAVLSTVDASTRRADRRARRQLGNHARIPRTLSR